MSDQTAPDVVPAACSWLATAATSVLSAACCAGVIFACAATQPATQPAAKWEILATGDKREPADDLKVDELLRQLDPLRAEKYLESAPTTQPTATYSVRITTVAPGESTRPE